MNKTKGRSKPPSFTDAELQKLAKALPQVSGYARARFWDARGIDWQDIVEEVYMLVLRGAPGRAWDRLAYPDPRPYLIKLVLFVGIDLLKEQKRKCEQTFDEKQHDKCDESISDPLEEEIKQFIAEKLQEIMRDIPHLKRIYEFQEQVFQERNETPFAKETAAALGIRVHDVNYAKRRAHSQWEAVKHGELKRLLQ